MKIEKKPVLAGAHKTFQCHKQTKMHLLALKAQNEGKIEFSPPICLT